MNTCEEIASDLAAFLRQRGVNVRKVRHRGVVRVTFDAASFATSAFVSTYMVRVTGANIMVDRVSGPATYQLSPHLPIWAANNGTP